MTLQLHFITALIAVIWQAINWPVGQDLEPHLPPVRIIICCTKQLASILEAKPLP